MYEVSEEFKVAMKKPVHKYDIYGYLNAVYISSKNIVQDSLKITNQCSDNDNVKIGQVYVGQLDIKLVGDDIVKYASKDKEISLFCGLLLENNTYEYIPIGVYKISEANWTVDGIEIVAYDAMEKFDKKFSAATLSGTLYAIVQQACTVCGVTLGTTQGEFSFFANSSETFVIYSENDCETWRDVLSWVAQTLCCYATIDRNGQLVFRQYNMDVVDEIDINRRGDSCSFSEYETFYTGLYRTDIDDGYAYYYGLETDDGLSYGLGQNPFLQYGVAATLEVYARAILDDLSVFKYTPFKAKMLPLPCYDLGDVLSFPNGIGDEDKFFCITKFTWSYNNDLEIEGVGDNPALATARSKVDKNITGLLSKADEDAIQYYDYVNELAYVIGDGEELTVLSLEYATKRDTHIDFHLEAVIEVETTEEADEENLIFVNDDCNIVAIVYLNDEIIDTYEAKTSEFDGTHLLHLIRTWTSSADELNWLKVKLTSTGGKVTILVGDLRAYIGGTGLVGQSKEDTVYNDDVTPFSFTFIKTNFTELANGVKIVPDEAGNNDTLARVTFNFINSFAAAAVAWRGMYFSTTLETGRLEYNVSIEGTSFVASEDGQYIITPQIYNATGFVAKNGGAVSYLASFDGGETWKGWDGSNWQDELEMTYATISTITNWPSPTMLKVVFEANESISGFGLTDGTIE